MAKKCKPWDEETPDMDDNLGGRDPGIDWTPHKMKKFTPRKLYFVMEQNRGGPHDVWARAEIARRQNEQLGCFLEQVGEHVETLGKSSDKLERLTRWLIWLTIVLIIFTAPLTFIEIRKFLLGG